MQKILSEPELLDFSRVVVLDKGNPFLENLLLTFAAEHKPIKVENFTLLGLSFRRVYIFTAKGRLARKQRRN